MKTTNHLERISALGITAFSIISFALAASPAAASAAAAAKTATKTAAQTASQQQHLQDIISKGDQEITRRLTSLSGLTAKISAATKLSAGDKATLTAEVNDTMSGLTALKTTLDGETTVDAARTDAQNIFTEYRVYALVTPKIRLIKVADDQQVVETKLTALAQKLQGRITVAKQAGKDVTALQSQLNDMTSKTTAAQGISSSVESSVIGLQPTDYNSNHAVLTGDQAQLKTAHADNQTARTDAQNIMAALKKL